MHTSCFEVPTNATCNIDAISQRVASCVHDVVEQLCCCDSTVAPTHLVVVDGVFSISLKPLQLPLPVAPLPEPPQQLLLTPADGGRRLSTRCLVQSVFLRRIAEHRFFYPVFCLVWVAQLPLYMILHDFPVAVMGTTLSYLVLLSTFLIIHCTLLSRDLMVALVNVFEWWYLALHAVTVDIVWVVNELARYRQFVAEGTLDAVPTPVWIDTVCVPLIWGPVMVLCFVSLDALLVPPRTKVFMQLSGVAWYAVSWVRLRAGDTFQNKEVPIELWDQRTNLRLFYGTLCTNIVAFSLKALYCFLVKRRPFVSIRSDLLWTFYTPQVRHPQHSDVTPSKSSSLPPHSGAADTGVRESGVSDRPAASNGTIVELVSTISSSTTTVSLAATDVNLEFTPVQ